MGPVMVMAAKTMAAMARPCQPGVARLSVVVARTTRMRRKVPISSAKKALVVWPGG
jgi:hypothetical protein